MYVDPDTGNVWPFGRADAPPSDEEYFAAIEITALEMTGRRPIVLRNPFSGAIFWVEGMHNCPRDVFNAAMKERMAGQGIKHVTKRLIH